MAQLSLSEQFKTQVSHTFGKQGEAWLENLPALISECEQRFHLTVGLHFHGLTYNFIAEATDKNNDKCILKLSVPNEEVNHEIRALQLMAGQGAVRLLQSDAEQGVLLLEKLSPAAMLSTVSDEAAAMSIAADVMQKIWRPVEPNHGFPTIQDWLTRLDNAMNVPQDFSGGLLDEAQRIAKTLLHDMEQVVLLHGDLHHFNIVSDQHHSWVCIDPKGVVGEKEYELGALLRNPVPDIATTMNTDKVINYRIDALSESFGFDRQKVTAWGFVQAMLAAVWSIDSQSHHYKYFLHCAEALSRIVR